jgi:hypothetical protein
LVVELDREGEDYVDYDLASPELHSALKANGFKLGIGSFSDIYFMDQVKCNKINLGLGTKSSHSTHSRFDMGIFDRQRKRLLDFAEMYQDVSWPEVADKGWGFFRDDCCDLCLEPTPFDRLIYDRRRDCLLCPSCAATPGDEMGAASDIKWLECESCGDPHNVDELVYDHLYNGFLCASCHYLLHGDTVLEGV